MIKYTPASHRTLQLFQTPFERSLDATNRWVVMADLVPWDEMAKVFYSKLSHDSGRETVDLRIVLGALLVKYIEDLSDERTIDYLQENIYAQYFIGLSSFTTDPIFVPSLFVKIRERLGESGSAKLNDLLTTQAVRLRAIKHRRKFDDGYDKSADVVSEAGSGG
jgi:IS5 family transposase